MPHGASFDALNAALEERCRARQAKRAGRHEQTIGERLVADQAVLRALPEPPFEPCDKRPGKVSSTALVRYRMDDYSMPTAYGFRDVLVKGFVDGLRSSAERARLPGIRASMVVASSFLTRSTIWRSSSKSLAPWTKRLPCRVGHLRNRSSTCGGSWKPDVVPETLVAAPALDAIRLGAISFDAVKSNRTMLRRRNAQIGGNQPPRPVSLESTELCHAAIRFDHRRGPGPY